MSKVNNQENLPIGYINYDDLAIPSGEVLTTSILELKEEKNAIVVGNPQQKNDLQGISDFMENDLQLIKIVENSPQNKIVFCGNPYAAKVAKRLCSTKKIIIPDSSNNNISLLENVFLCLKYEVPEVTDVTIIRLLPQ